MMRMDNWAVALLVILAAILLFAFISPFVRSARLRRRLRKTRNRVVSKARQPSVQLNVKTPKE